MTFYLSIYPILPILLRLGTLTPLDTVRVVQITANLINRNADMFLFMPQEQSVTDIDGIRDILIHADHLK